MHQKWPILAPKACFFPTDFLDFPNLEKSKHAMSGHASPNGSPLRSFLACMQCTHARGIASCTEVEQRSPQSPPMMDQSWGLGTPNFSPLGTSKSGSRVQNWPFLMQKWQGNGGVLPPIAGFGHLVGTQQAMASCVLGRWCTPNSLVSYKG